MADATATANCIIIVNQECFFLKPVFCFQTAGGMGRDDADRFGAPARGQTEAQPVWDMESADYECDCPGPPPPFQVPPPPRPPFLLDADCSELPLSDLETCEAVPVSIDR